jgi:enolase
LDLVKEAIEKAGYTGKIKIGMDVAASEFYTGRTTNLSLLIYIISLTLSLEEKKSYGKFCQFVHII